MAARSSRLSPTESLAHGEAIAELRASTASGEPPLFELERGRSPSPSSSPASRRDRRGAGRPVDLDGYGARLMGELRPNERCSRTTARCTTRGVRLRS